MYQIQDLKACVQHCQHSTKKKQDCTMLSLGFGELSAVGGADDITGGTAGEQASWTCGMHIVRR
jgi:hypothetical protein